MQPSKHRPGWESQSDLSLKQDPSKERLKSDHRTSGILKKVKMNQSKERLSNTPESLQDRHSRGLEDVVVTSGVVLRREGSRCWCEGSAGLGAESEESFEAIEANGEGRL